ncbi:unnamed protein product, partial [Ectocarpus sp. 4 AP-2014]
TWRIQTEQGDGARGFRAIARHFLGDPNLHLEVRQQVVEYLSNNQATIQQHPKLPHCY